MTDAKWRAKIKQQCEDAQTFKPSFNSTIDALAKILEQRDAALALYKAEGCQLIVERISDRGSSNPTINPLVQLLDKLNNTALAYWKELGLTPVGWKKINGGSVPAEKKKSGLAEALSKLETD